MTYSLQGIGKTLALERKRRGLTQRRFAERSGTTQARVSKIENGETDPRVSTLIELSRALELELVLVPRTHLPAVHAIISNVGDSRLASKLLRELTHVIDQAKDRLPGNEDLELLERLAGELEKYRPADHHLTSIRKAMADVKRVDESPELAGTLKAPVERLRALRDDLVHQPPRESEPRPAYRIEEEDDG